MSPAPADFLRHLQTKGYHPRSDKHSNSLAEGILGDLLTHCPKIRKKAATGDLVFDLNFTIMAGPAELEFEGRVSAEMVEGAV